LKNTELEHK